MKTRPIGTVIGCGVEFSRASAAAGACGAAGVCSPDDLTDVLCGSGNLVSSDFFHLLCTDPCCNDDE